MRNNIVSDEETVIITRVISSEIKLSAIFFKVAQLSFPRENNVRISKSELLRTVQIVYQQRRNQNEHFPGGRSQAAATNENSDILAYTGEASYFPL